MHKSGRQQQASGFFYTYDYESLHSYHPSFLPVSFLQPGEKENPRLFQNKRLPA
jgi:hypothetical protein